MLSAFLRYRAECTQHEKGTLAELYSVEHAIRETVTVPGQSLTRQQLHSPVPSVPCTALECRRCAAQQGGYQFRWFSALWASEYKAMRRLGSWVPGQPDQE